MLLWRYLHQELTDDDAVDYNEGVQEQIIVSLQLYFHAQKDGGHVNSQKLVFIIKRKPSPAGVEYCQALVV